MLIRNFHCLRHGSGSGRQIAEDASASEADFLPSAMSSVLIVPEPVDAPAGRGVPSHSAGGCVLESRYLTTVP